jgi:PilZ domain
MVDRPHLSLVASVRPGLATRSPQLMSLSQGSLVVRAHEFLKPGQKARVTIHFIDSGQDVEIDVEVVWANHKLGDMALRFETLGEVGREAVARFIADRAARR